MVLKYGLPIISKKFWSTPRPSRRDQWQKNPLCEKIMQKPLIFQCFWPQLRSTRETCAEGSWDRLPQNESCPSFLIKDFNDAGVFPMLFARLWNPLFPWFFKILQGGPNRNFQKLDFLDFRPHKNLCFFNGFEAPGPWRRLLGNNLFLRLALHWRNNVLYMRFPKTLFL